MKIWLSRVAAGDRWWSKAYNLDTVHKTTDGSGVTVCVLDSAINAGVREFDGAMLKLKSPVTTDSDDALVKVKSSPAVYSAHGTSMTALIIGQGKGNGPAGTGISGVAPGATVNFYQADADPTTPRIDSGDFPALIHRRLVDGCTLFSISASGVQLDPGTLARINQAGAVILIGDQVNGGDPHMEGSVVVGAADRDGMPWGDDAQPEGPDVIAPGVDINSGNNDASAATPRFISNYVNSGSSDATAITAGLLALVKSKYPDATGNQLIQALIHSNGGTKSWSATPKSGWGVVQLKDMLERDPSGWPDINPTLMERQAIVDTFPESVWKDPNAPAAPQADTSTAQTAAPNQDDDGLPIWVWPAGAVILIGAATTVVIARGRSSDTT